LIVEKHLSLEKLSQIFSKKIKIIFPNLKNLQILFLIKFKKIIEQLDRADAHPYGSRPFKRQNYIKKFLTLTNFILDKKESSRFLKTVQNLKNLKSGELDKLNIKVKKTKIKKNFKKGIF